MRECESIKERNKFGIRPGLEFSFIFKVLRAGKKIEISNYFQDLDNYPLIRETV